MPHSKLHDNVIVYAGSVVMKEETIPRDSIVAGNPAVPVALDTTRKWY